MSNKNTYSAKYREARCIALKRSGGQCQFCGSAPATEAHHWATEYPDGESVSPDDLTALCTSCHFFATSLRRFIRANGNRWQFKKAYEEAIRKCDTEFKCEEYHPSYITMASRGLIQTTPSKRKQKKLKSVEGRTGPKRTISNSVKLVAGLPYGKTSKERLEYLRALSKQPSKTLPANSKKAPPFEKA